MATEIIWWSTLNAIRRREILYAGQAFVAQSLTIIFFDDIEEYGIQVYEIGANAGGFTMSGARKLVLMIDDAEAVEKLGLRNLKSIHLKWRSRHSKTAWNDNGRMVDHDWLTL